MVQRMVDLYKLGLLLSDNSDDTTPCQRDSTPSLLRDDSQTRGPDPAAGTQGIQRQFGTTTAAPSAFVATPAPMWEVKDKDDATTTAEESIIQKPKVPKRTFKRKAQPTTEEPCPAPQVPAATTVKDGQLLEDPATKMRYLVHFVNPSSAPTGPLTKTTRTARLLLETFDALIAPALIELDAVHTQIKRLIYHSILAEYIATHPLDDTSDDPDSLYHAVRTVLVELRFIL